MVDLHDDTIRRSSARFGAAAALILVGAATSVALGALPFQNTVPVRAAVLVYLGIAVAAFAGLVRHHPHPRFGAANAVTVLRAGGVAVFAAFAVEPGAVLAVGPWATFAAVLALLALDGLDGWLARRQALQSRFGARFDMEVDALFILILAIVALGLGKAGQWVLGLGLMRYGFLLAGLVAPWLNRPLPVSLRRKTVCVTQIAALAALLLPPVAPPWSQAVAAAAFAALGWSFAVDIRWLYRVRAE